ncbi:MAG: DEAD/DEAH box helicase, partial [Flavobacteriaceae bacterium]|nr:DEAD/DEAH box helicase [Flavobacteriaceae bacterium]
REQMVEEYRSFTGAFVDPRDERIAGFIRHRLDSGAQWPDPWLSLNPSFASGGTVTELVSDGLLHEECDRIFRAKRNEEDRGTPLNFHRHQVDAFRAAATGNSYVLTTGTGSGKSLAYIVPIVDRILRGRLDGAEPRVSAIIVYPMNALANSQELELEKFLRYGYGEGKEPVTFKRYTGQEKPDDRRAILADPPD